MDAGPRMPHFQANNEDFTSLRPGVELGTLIDVAIGANGHVFLLHQPIKSPQNEGVGKEEAVACVVELSGDGMFLRSWGDAHSAPDEDGVSQWPERVENLTIDHEGNFWIFGYGPEDHAILKFTPEGEFLLRLGQRGVRGDNSSKTHFGVPTDICHSAETNEFLIADGYQNRRIIALDGSTLEHTRTWGAFGENPSSQPSDRAFGNPVHAIVRGPDGLFYVCDRIKNRIQSFLVADEIHFVREINIAPGTMLFGSAFDIAFSPCERYMYVADGSNNCIWVVSMGSFEVLGWVGGKVADEGRGNESHIMTMMHRFAVGSEGDLFVARPKKGLKVLKFQGLR